MDKLKQELKRLEQSLESNLTLTDSVICEVESRIGDIKKTIAINESGVLNTINKPLLK